MQGSARVQIDPRQPFSIDTVLLDMTASGIKSANAALAGVSAHVALSPRAQAPLEVAIAATGLDAAGFRSDALTLNASGTTARHTLSARSNDTAQRWSIGASGGLVALRPELRWDGRIDIVDGVGQYAVKLQAPAALSVAQQRVTLDDFALQVDGMTLAIDRFLRDDSGIVTRGRVTHVAAATLLKLVKPAPAISGDLQLGGTWDIKLADALNGSVHVAREQGDLSMRGSTPVALGLTQLQLDVGAVDGRLSARLQADGAQLGRIAMTAASNSGRGEARLTLAPDAALSANASIAIPSLNWVGPMIAPAVVTAGQLQSEIAVSGTVAAPRFNGKLSGSGLRVFLADEGIDLRNGVLDSSFDGERLVVQQLRFEQAGGSLQASGPINLTAGQPEALIALKADHFALLDRSDRKLVISGQSDITWRDQRASISGTVRADSGSFDLGRADAPQLSDDVVIVGRGQQGGGRTVAALDLTFDLGDGVALTGRGIEARLAGKLHITSSGREALRAQGTLAFEQGTYNAYGRKLAIEQGVMRFNGPLNNPSLDILAMRRGGEVEAGVAVRGSVLLPRITLVSEPTVSDAEKLSWLVLGKGLDSAGTGDAGVLQAAAATLLSQSAAAGVQSRLSSTFGLENFSVGKSTDSLQQRIVTVGKQISARLYVSYEQGLESANSVLHLRYTLTPKLTLEAEAGARSALSLFYNILFD
jgi:translocation and assembly module TamB